MIHVFLAEVRKLKRITLSLPTLLAAAGLTALTTSLLYLLIDSPRGNGREGARITPEILSKANGVVHGFQETATLLGVIALCIFAAQTAQEYTYGTLRNILVRQPSRMKVLGGKYLAMVLFATIIVIVAAAVSISISFGLAGGANVSTTLWTTSAGYHAMTEAFVNVFISTICFGTLGMILGLLLRSPISSIAIGVIWILIVENLLSAVVNQIGKWLPGQLLTAVSMGGTPKDPITGAAEISYQRGIVGGVSYIIAGAIVVSILFKQRDVAN